MVAMIERMRFWQGYPPDGTPNTDKTPIRFSPIKPAGDWK
jgi:hypothetical protein